MAKSVATALVIALTLAAPVFAADIDACKYLVVTDFTEDPYGIAKELRAQGRERGFIVVAGPSEVPSADAFKMCLMLGNWSVSGSSGRITIRVVDAVSGAVIAEASTGATNWWGIERTVRGGVRRVYEQLRYTGFKEDVYRARIERQYPLRPKLSITEAEVRGKELQSSVEGIWTDREDQYRLAIIGAPEGTGADYVGVVLRSSSPVWHVGEIKAELRSTASPNVFTSTYFMLNKQPVGTTFTLDSDSLLRATVKTQTGESELVLMRVWPAIRTDGDRIGSGASGVSGTGFLVTKSGLIATNWHVVAGADAIDVAFPDWSATARAEVVIRDVTNDLAVLRVTGGRDLGDVCPELPFQLISASRISLGDHVSTIGYPLQSILGSNPKFSEGVVSSKTGWQDDPRSLQVSAQVQPGSSGGPLFDKEGNVVGVVVATLDSAKLYAIAGAIPQNVNWAVKADYLLNLIGMLPGESSASRVTGFSPEKAARCVALVTAR